MHFVYLKSQNYIDRFKIDSAICALLLFSLIEPVQPVKPDCGVRVVDPIKLVMYSLQLKYLRWF